MWFKLGISKYIWFVVCLYFLNSCHYENKDVKPFYTQHLIDFLNDNLNEAIIQDGFSPPVASRIYAYVNLAAYEAYNFKNISKIKLKGVLNDFNPKYGFQEDKLVDNEFTMFTAFYKTAYELVYRDFIIDSLIVTHKKYFKSTLPTEIYSNSEILGTLIAHEIIVYFDKDMYKETRSYPLYEQSNKPGGWEPTPPYYGTPVEPHWGAIRPFLTVNLDSFMAPAHVPFDSLVGSSFYELNEQVYEAVLNAGTEGKEVAMYWDGDPMPPRRIKRINIIKRQLNPVGHWIAIGKTLNNLTKKTEDESITTYLRTSLVMADAMIIGWKNKYIYNMVRPHTYINRYIDSKWDPVLATPLFPEYPSGHSVLAGSCAGVLIDIFGDSIAFTDDSQIRFGFKPRHFKSISDAAEECATSRITGGIHYQPAVAYGIELGNKVAQLHVEKLRKENN